MNKIDMRNLPSEVAAYIRSLEKKAEKLERENKKLQGLTEQLVKMRKRMFGQSSEQAHYVNGEQLNFLMKPKILPMLVPRSLAMIFR